jgi:hypothetical protein
MPAKSAPVGVAMEGRVEICAGIGDHVDPADLEGRSVLVKARGFFAGPKVADMRAGKPL